MKLDELQDKLMRTARRMPPDDRVPYAFEKRVMARLRSRGVPDRWALWASGLWRAAAPCMAICLLLVGWSVLAPETGGGLSDFTQDLEYTVLVAADQDTAPDPNW